MNSNNFSLLINKWPELERLGREAENYVYSDPQSCLMKLRCFIEIIVGNLYRDLKLNCNENWDLFKKLKNEEFEKIISSTILTKFHAIRIKGNNAVHRSIEIDSKDALWLLKEAYIISCWLCKSYKLVLENNCNEFIPPVDNGNKINMLNKTIEELETTLNNERNKNKELNRQIVINNESEIEEFQNFNNSISQEMRINNETIKEKVSLNDLFLDYALTNAQETLINKLKTFIEDKNQNVFLLKGYAGTGKTFITKGLTEYLTTVGRSFVLAAPTGKAAKVIQEKTKSKAYTIHRTIYSDKDLKEYKLNDSDRTFKFYFDLRINEDADDTIYIIDEASMISNVYNEMEFLRFGSGYLLNDFIKYANLDQNDHNKKIILIGDNAQLPPVGMNFSPALDNKYLHENYGLNVSQYELTEVVRQKEFSGILSNANKLRDSLTSKIFNQIKIDTNYDDTKHIEHGDFIQKYIDLTNKKASKDTMVIAYTNSSVMEYNQSIRKLFFDNIEQIHVRDKVMILSNSSHYEIFLSNGDFGLVKSLLSDREVKIVTLKRKNQDTNHVEQIKVNLYFRDIELIVKDINNSPKVIRCKIIENLLFSEKPNLSSDENKALYLDFVIRYPNLKPNSKEFKDQIKSDSYFNALKIKFGYAITCHKAQGSEWKNVILNCSYSDNVLTEGYFRWLYTAITRASENLYTLDEPRISQFNDIASSNIHLEHINDSHINRKIQASNDNNFNIEDDFLLLVYQKINGILEVNGIKILYLQHNSYQEIYTFEKDNEQIRCMIHYNSKNIITNIKTLENTSLSTEIKKLLSPIEGHILSVNTSISFNFDEPFLEDFYKNISNTLKKSNITVSSIDHNTWMERYTFTRNDEIAIIDFYYNKKGQFKSPTPNKKSNSKVLINDILGNLK